jgi:hypothetical protein
MFPFCDVSYNTMNILIMYLTLLVKFFESNGQLNSVWLSPNTKIWYLDSQLPTHELEF